MNAKFESIIPQRLVCGSAVLLIITGLLAEDWPQWRGPERSNASRETGLLKQWPTNGPPLVWRATGIGLGIHSVSVAGGRVFTVGNREGGEFVFALDAKMGEKLWAYRMGKPVVEESPSMRWLTQRTPTADGDRVYAFSINGELFCLRAADGQKVWQRNYPEDFGTRRHVWGYCDRPLVDGDRLIVTPFGTKMFIAALDKRTGAVVWQIKLDDPPAAGHASLVMTEAGGMRQYVVFHAKGLSGFAADDGRPLWSYARPTNRIAMSYTPVASGDMVYSPNGYGGGLAAIRLVRETDRFTVQEVYHQPVRFGPFTDITAWVGDSLYGFDGSSPFCVELKTGKSMWNTNLEPQSGRAFFTYADGHLYLRQGTGTMSLIQVSAERPELRSRFNIPEHEESYGVTAPVVAVKRLYLRDNSRLFCYDISAEALTRSPIEPNHVTVGLTSRELEEDENAPRQPRVGVNRAPDAVFVPTPHDIVERMFQEAGVKKTDVVVDLGSGDGRFVIAAARKFGCKTIGFEIDPQLVHQSREAVARENLGTLASIEHKDIFTVDLSGADVITVFLYPRLMERLIPQFEKLKPGSRIVSHQFEMPGVKPDRTLIVESEEDGDNHRIFLWTTPLRKESNSSPFK